MFPRDLYRSSTVGRLGRGFERLFALSQAARLPRRSGIAPAQEVAPLAANGFNVDILSRLGLEESACSLGNIGAERARQSFVASDDDQQNIFLRPLRQQGMLRLSRLRIVNLRPCHQRLQ